MVSEVIRFLRKAASSISVTDAGISMEGSRLLRKASLPMMVTDAGILRFAAS